MKNMGRIISGMLRAGLALLCGLSLCGQASEARRPEEPILASAAVRFADLLSPEFLTAEELAQLRTGEVNREFIDTNAAQAISLLEAQAAAIDPAQLSADQVQTTLEIGRQYIQAFANAIPQQIDAPSAFSDISNWLGYNLMVSDYRDQFGLDANAFNESHFGFISYQDEQINGLHHIPGLFEKAVTREFVRRNFDTPAPIRTVLSEWLNEEFRSISRTYASEGPLLLILPEIHSSGRIKADNLTIITGLRDQISFLATEGYEGEYHCAGNWDAETIYTITSNALEGYENFFGLSSAAAECLNQDLLYTVGLESEAVLRYTETSNITGFDVAEGRFDSAGYREQIRTLAANPQATLYDYVLGHNEDFADPSLTQVLILDYRSRIWLQHLQEQYPQSNPRFGSVNNIAALTCGDVHITYLLEHAGDYGFSQAVVVYNDSWFSPEAFQEYAQDVLSE